MTRAAEGTVAERAVAWLLGRLWRWMPPTVRSRHALEAVSVFHQQSQHYRRLGTSRLLAYWLRTLVDVWRSARRLRRDPANQMLDPQRARGGASLMTGLRDDLRAAWRSLAAAPLFTLTAVAILSLGVGGSAGVFSLLKAVILDPLPFEEPDDLVILWTWNERRELPDGTSYANWESWRDRSRSFEDLALYARPEFTSATWERDGETRRIETAMVTPSFFDVLGAQPVLGRGFTPEEEQSQAALIILSDALWQQEFGGSPDALGQTVDLDGEQLEIIGVMPPGFRFPLADTAVWTLHSWATGWPEREFSRDMDFFVVLGRLAAGVDADTARVEINQVADQLSAEFPETNLDFGVRLLPLTEQVVGSSLPRALWLLFGAMVAVLLICASNVAHLALARGSTRRREFAVRAAIGAAGARLGRQQAIEAGLLAALAGVLGSLVGIGMLRALVALAPADLPRLEQVNIDPLVLGGAWLATVLLGLSFSVIPAWAAARTDAGAVLRDAARSSESARATRFRSGLVVAEVAVAMLLVSAAALLLQSLIAASDENPGIAVVDSVIARLHLPAAYEPPDIQQFLTQTIARLEAMPGVDSAGAISSLFMYRIPDVRISLEGRDPEENPRVPTTYEMVFPGFFTATGGTLLDGREHALADLEADLLDRGVVVNETAARAYWPGERAVGKRFYASADPQPDDPLLEVIGVVTDLRRAGLDITPVAQLYLPSVFREVDLVVRAEPGQAGAAAGLVREVVAEIEPRAPISNLRGLDEAFGASLSQRRFQGLLALAFATIAVILSAAGLFGLLFEAVARRRREMGVRLALGAEPRSLLAGVVGRAVGLTAVGVALGLASSYAIADLIGAFLYDVSATEPGTLALAAVGLLAVGALASLLPGLRATRVDPVESLSAE